MKIKGDGVNTDFSRVPGTQKALSSLSVLLIILTRMLALLIVGDVERTRAWRLGGPGSSLGLSAH